MGLPVAIMTAKISLFHMLRNFTLTGTGPARYRILTITKPRIGLPVLRQNNTPCSDLGLTDKH